MGRNKKYTARCIVRPDRTVFTSDADLTAAVKKLVGFRTVSDHVLLNLDMGPYRGPYGRVRELVNDSTKTRVLVSHTPRYRRLPWMRVAVVPDDRPGLRRRELERILRAFKPYRLAIIEFALDFSKGMNAARVLRNCKFGKCQARLNRRFPGAAWLGAPGSGRFLRAYWKSEVIAFRVEAQFNRAYLEKLRIQRPGDFLRLPAVIKKDLRILDVHWPKLEAYANRHLRHSQVFFRMARQRRRSLTELRRFLRNLGISDPDRFMEPMDVNVKIAAALELWGRRWRNESSRRQDRA